VPASAVAEHLAALNYEVHLNTPDHSVGPCSIVAWRHRTNGVHKGGGNHQAYIGNKRDRANYSLPMIVSGIDMQALANLLLPSALKQLQALKEGKPAEDDTAEIEAAVARLPRQPDEKLR
jgi:hypothetical protein